MLYQLSYAPAFLRNVFALRERYYARINRIYANIFSSKTNEFIVVKTNLLICYRYLLIVAMIKIWQH